MDGYTLNNKVLLAAAAGDDDLARVFQTPDHVAMTFEWNLIHRLIYTNGEQFFIVTPPIDGQPATHANGGTIGLTMNSPEQVDAWHAAGVAAGGTSIEDPPGIRENARLKLYLAYLRDPDGNKLCATYRYR